MKTATARWSVMVTSMPSFQEFVRWKIRRSPAGTSCAGALAMAVARVSPQRHEDLEPARSDEREFRRFCSQPSRDGTTVPPKSDAPSRDRTDETLDEKAMFAFETEVPRKSSLLFADPRDAKTRGEFLTDGRDDLKQVLAAIQQQWCDARRESLECAGRRSRYPSRVSGRAIEPDVTV